ncbi:acyl-CoA thioesterase [Parvularcula maris]|uniref:Acyl-CoA thioesterase n=1 Tax=Parvularcula maris TaxID=2965077 RepID=A0A9X2RIJ1_9PROT|nr:thioesterase family protein [Parvularcula maris]MCQ8186059.1 acyl-CoA thioesterase [Parvularcula maris]
MSDFSDYPRPDGPLLGAHSFETACLSRRTAKPSEIDELGHVNNAVYARWIQDAAVGHWLSVTEGSAVEDQVWVCSRHEIDYKDQVLEGQTVEIRTWLGEAKGARFARHTDIRLPGASRPAATGLTWWVLVDAATRRPRRVGQEVMALFGLA